MDKTYNPQAVEEKWQRVWLERGAFHSDASRGGEPYCVVIPPPNVTGILHMGHALNNTIQDVLVRWRRMQGRNVVWLPGTDHAGIATQNVVERALRQEGLRRQDLGREAFLQRVWQWREQYGRTIIRQLQRLGASCDWQRERFTMDPGLSEAVAEVFVRLFDKGLVYRANYIINWCPRCQTALSDEESEHQPAAGRLYYLRYDVEQPGEGPPQITVATTRPETLLGDTAVAVHPADPRYRWLHGRTVRLPVLGRSLPVIQDEFVSAEFGTGIVKVTPAHDPNDFELGRRHGLPSINVMNGDGTMNERAGPYQGLERFECRRRILADLEREGRVEKIEKHEHAVGHCYRCDTIVEPRLSPQWFVKMKPLAAPAIEAVKSGRIVFVPGRWTKVYLEWMENIRDWCISRQIWWGHRIPVFTCGACAHVWAARRPPERCPRCGSGAFRQDEDVLDTWFSSWLWPFSAFGWPQDNADLRFYYPTHDLVTASEIIFFWVARMIMAGYEFMGDAPFRTVVIHGTVRDDSGRKMSKSLGNSIDPLTIVEQFSADALRFSLMMITATGQDVFLSNDKFEIGRNFGTKLWNAARFLRLHSGEDDRPRPPTAPEMEAERLTPDDQHILARLHETIAACTESLERYRFNDAAHALYEFVWHQYCDWYVEYAKEPLSGPADRREPVLAIMRYVFGTVLRLLHPFMPFLTEELWQALHYGAEGELLLRAPWPVPDPERLRAWRIDPAAVAYVEDKHELVRLGRTLRADYGVPPAERPAYIVRPATPEAARRLQSDADAIRALLRAGALTVDATFAPGRAVPNGATRLGVLYLPVEGLIDVAAEKARIAGQLAKVTKDLERTAAKLSNLGFVQKAPAQVVDDQRRRQQELLEHQARLERLLATLEAMAG